MMRQMQWWIGVVLVVQACGLLDGYDGSIQLISVPAGDTVLAPGQPLVVEVGAPPGTLVTFSASTAARSNGFLDASVFIGSSPDDPTASINDTATTDGSRRATVFVRPGLVATEAIVTVTVPAFSDSIEVRIPVRPGNAVRLLAGPRDTALYVGRTFALRANLVDRFGNQFAADSMTFVSDSSYVAISGTGQVTASVIGRARLRVQSGMFADTAWASVVPQGRIAAVRYGGVGVTAQMVLVNLDGSDIRTFPLQLFDVPRPAWHPNGSYLVASLLPAGGAFDAARRLSRLDTATGVWHQIPGTMSTLGDGYAQFSRDGQWIYLGNGPSTFVFSSFGSAVFRVRADGSGSAERVGYDSRSSYVFDFPSPSPTGDRVAIMIQGSGGTYTFVTSSAPPLGPPPQEGTLVLNRPTGGRAVWSPVSEDLLMFGAEGMWLMTAGASTVADRRYLAPGWGQSTIQFGGYRGASWSPDGKWIVAKANADMILVEVATNRVLPLVFARNFADPAWRP